MNDNCNMHFDTHTNESSEDSSIEYIDDPFEPLFDW